MNKREKKREKKKVVYIKTSISKWIWIKIQIILWEFMKYEERSTKFVVEHFPLSTRRSKQYNSIRYIKI